MAVDLMQMNVDMNQVAASREHALAMTRDYISQPRLSMYKTILLFKIFNIQTYFGSKES